MTEAHIYIYGIISPYQGSMAEDFGEVNLKQVTTQIQSAKDADTLKVHIRSEGGDVNEGFAIYDALVNSGKAIDTIGEGIVASIATVIFLAGKNRVMSQNAEFLIHNPWNMGIGTADEMQKNADQLKSAEAKLVKFYNDKTGTDEETLKALMKDETILSADQAKNYGFATDVLEVFKAVALFNNSNNLTMTKEELEKSIDSKFDVFLNKVKNLFTPVKDVKVTTGDGKILEFPDLQEGSEIAVGATAKNEDGSAANGDYVMPDGRTFVFEAGTLKEIKEAESDTEALKAENEALKTEIETLKAQNSTYKTSIEGFKTEITGMKAQMKSEVEGFMKDFKPVGNPTEVRKINKSLI